MAMTWLHNHNDDITTATLTGAIIPVLYPCPANRRDGQTVLSDPEGPYMWPTLPFKDVRVVPGSALEMFVDPKRRDQFQRDFGPVNDEDRRSLLYLLRLAEAVSVSHLSVEESWKIFRKAEAQRLGITSELEGRMARLSDVVGTVPAVELLDVLNNAITGVRLVTWWSTSERKIGPGLYCEDLKTALHAVALVHLRRPKGLASCLRCGKEIIKHKGNHSYCSHSCQTAAAQMRYRANKKQREKVPVKKSTHSKRSQRGGR